MSNYSLSILWSIIIRQNNIFFPRKNVSNFYTIFLYITVLFTLFHWLIYVSSLKAASYWCLHYLHDLAEKNRNAQRTQHFICIKMLPSYYVSLRILLNLSEFLPSYWESSDINACLEACLWGFSPIACMSCTHHSSNVHSFPMKILFAYLLNG